MNSVHWDGIIKQIQWWGQRFKFLFPENLNCQKFNFQQVSLRKEQLSSLVEVKEILNTNSRTLGLKCYTSHSRGIEFSSRTVELPWVQVLLQEGCVICRLEETLLGQSTDGVEVPYL